ncbi:DUF1565 domain-containing protein [Bacillus sp. SL00103]
MKRAIPGILLILFMTLISFGCQAMTEEAGAKQSNSSLSCSDNGNDKNPGTKQKPFRTLKKAASMAKAGTTIYVRRHIQREIDCPPFRYKEHQLSFKLMKKKTCY